MPEFTRGDLLVRVVLTTTPAQIYEAKIDTEITLIMAAATLGDFTMDLYQGDTAVPGNELFWKYPVSVYSQGVILAGQEVGCGLHISPGDRLWASADPGCTISVYGVTQGLPEIL